MPSARLESYWPEAAGRRRAISKALVFGLAIYASQLRITPPPRKIRFRLLVRLYRVSFSLIIVSMRWPITPPSLMLTTPKAACWLPAEVAVSQLATASLAGAV